MTAKAGRESFLIITAAIAEAERCGHFMVDTDHVLLGLLAAGGDAAAALMQQGLTLTRLREAMDEVQRQDVEKLLETDHLPTIASRVRSAPTYEADGSIPWSPRAKNALKGGTGQELVVLLASQPGPARRLLEHVGAETCLSVLHGSPRQIMKVTGSGFSAEGVVAVPPGRLLAVAADERQLGSWFGAYTTRRIQTTAEAVILTLLDEHGNETRVEVTAHAHGVGSQVALVVLEEEDHSDHPIAGRLLKWMRTAHLRASITSLASISA